MPDRWHAFDHYAYAAIAVLGTFAAIAGIDWLMVASPWAAWTHGLNGVAAPFSNVLGVLFGLTVAFLSNDTWTAHDRARSALLRESDAVRGLDVLAATLPDPIRAPLRRAVADYARAAAAEWPALAHCTTHEPARDAADRLLERTADRRVAEAAGNTVQQLMLAEVAAIRQNRDARIGLSRTHVNPLKWMGMAFLGFLTLVSVAVIHANDPRSALIAMVIFGCAAAPTAAIVLIHGNPFQPPSAVKPNQLLEALADRP
ncbi:MAG: DUF4239 domain-containing protein [Paracoccaceae bacterium]|nr:DUF4239 domain-containing protein [Paracoccaceae bacterium]